MNSIYERMNKIDDRRSLNECWNVKNHRRMNEKRGLRESATGTMYSAILLNETVLAMGDVDPDGNPYDTVKDEFIPVTIEASSDREAIEKISQYVQIVLDEDDYSEDSLIGKINTAAFPITFEDWNANYYDVGDSNMAIISFKRPDGTELATESEIQAANVNDAVKKYKELYLPENSIYEWELKFESITVGKPLSL